MKKVSHDVSSDFGEVQLEFKIRQELTGITEMYTWENWVEFCLKKFRLEYRNSTYIHYSGILAKWVTPYWKGFTLDEITTENVHDVVFILNQNISSALRRNIHKSLRRVLNIAVEEGQLDRNPAVGVRVRVPAAYQSVLSKSEIDVLLKEAKLSDHKFYEIWAMAILTGMRSGELYALNWNDINFDSGKISINKAWTSKNGFGSTKTAKNRVVPMSKACRQLLQELKLKTGNTDFVLPRFWEWDKGCMARSLRDFCESIAITSVKFHDLRATFITQMLMNGVALAKVMAIVGHASLKTTQGYLRLCGKEVEGATEMLGVDLPTLGAPGDVIEVDFRP
ncbi:MAG: site-specific integrase [Bdellovibrionaceae bacterium]|nr:site-specific integrase [Pseudobdellovibrionaceae bacterium]